MASNRCSQEVRGMGGCEKAVPLSISICWCSMPLLSSLNATRSLVLCTSRLITAGPAAVHCQQNHYQPKGKKHLVIQTVLRCMQVLGTVTFWVPHVDFRKGTVPLESNQPESKKIQIPDFSLFQSLDFSSWSSCIDFSVLDQIQLRQGIGMFLLQFQTLVGFPWLSDKCKMITYCC